MAITVCPVTPSFAAEIGDVDLSRPIEPPDLLAIKEAFAKYAVLIFPDQQLSQDQHLDFARHFGPLETTIALHRKDAQLRVRKEFADVSNLDPNNEVWGKELQATHVPAGQPALAHRLHRSSGCRRWHRCFMRARFRRLAGIPNSPTSGRLTMRFPKP